MNRVEKLLFSKRSPLRRALVEETSREERLKLLPDIARQMREAGLISRDLELETAGYARQAMHRDSRGANEIATAAEFEDLWSALRDNRIRSVPEQLKKIALAYFFSLAFACSRQTEIASGLVHGAATTHLSTFEALDQISGFNPSRSIPIFGFLFDFAYGFKLGRVNLIHGQLSELGEHLPNIFKSFGTTWSAPEANPQIEKPRKEKARPQILDRFFVAAGFIYLVLLASILVVKLLFDLTENVVLLAWAGSGAESAGVGDAGAGLMDAINRFSPFSDLEQNFSNSALLGNIAGTSLLGWTIDWAIFWTIWFFIIWLCPLVYLIILTARNSGNLTLVISTMAGIDFDVRQKNLGQKSTLSRLINFIFRAARHFSAFVLLPAILFFATVFGAAINLTAAYVIAGFWFLAILLKIIVSGNDHSNGRAAWLALVFSLLVSPVLCVSSLAAMEKELGSATTAGNHKANSEVTLSFDRCGDGYVEWAKYGRYLRVGEGPVEGSARVVLRPQDLPLETLTATGRDGIIVADAESEADWGLAKRGAGVPIKPVETVPGLQVEAADSIDASGNDLVLEPAYINVKLCVREGAELPPELAALSAEGAN